MDKDYILTAVQEYADECLLDEPRKGMRREQFKRCSYKKWAVSEVVECIRESEGILPAAALESYIHMIHRFCCRKGKDNLIFSVAYDVAVDIQGFLTALDGEECQI